MIDVNSARLRIVCAALIIHLGAATICAHSGPFDGRSFRGRIAYSCDGNHNDPDDWIASPVTLAILAEAGLRDKLVHYDYNCILPQTDEKWEKIHAQSVLGTAQRYGYNPALFFDDRNNLAEAVASLAKVIDESSAENPLYLIIAGPVEVPLMGINKSDPARRKFVYCISHSRWNDGFASKYTFANTKRSVIEAGVHWVQIKDQNRLLSTSPYGRVATEEQWRPYHWMRDSTDEKLKWLWERMQVSTRPDPSDAGMAYFLVSGDEEASPTKLQQLLAEHRVPAPAIRKQVRIEAENFSSLDGFEVEDRNDKSASHQLQVKNNGGEGAIRTAFDEPYAASGARYEVEVRYSGGQGGRFQLSVNGRPLGEAWAGSAGQGWKTQEFAAVEVHEGDEIAIAYRGQAEARLDYVQLNRIPGTRGDGPDVKR